MVYFQTLLGVNACMVPELAGTANPNHILSSILGLPLHLWTDAQQSAPHQVCLVQTNEDLPLVVDIKCGVSRENHLLPD